MKIDKFKDQDNWVDWVGLYVTKHSGRPFKSGDLISRITKFTINPYSLKPAFEMDDESVVDCYQVKLADKLFDKPFSLEDFKDKTFFPNKYNSNGKYNISF